MWCGKAQCRYQENILRHFVLLILHTSRKKALLPSDGIELRFGSGLCTEGWFLGFTWEMMFFHEVWTISFEIYNGIWAPKWLLIIKGSLVLAIACEDLFLFLLRGDWHGPQLDSPQPLVQYCNPCSLICCCVGVPQLLLNGADYFFSSVIIWEDKTEINLLLFSLAQKSVEYGWSHHLISLVSIYIDRGAHYLYKEHCISEPTGKKIGGEDFY